MESIATNQEPQAQVFARLNFFKEKIDHITVDGGTSIKEVWDKLKIPKDLNPLSWINGHPVDGDTIVGVGDVVNVTVAPRNYAGWMASNAASVGGLVMSGGSSPAAPSKGVSVSGIRSMPLTNAPSSMQKQTPWQQASPWLGGALGLGAQLLLSFWGRSRDQNNKDTAQSDLAQNAENLSGNDASSLDGFGGPSDTMLPQITGVSNRSNPYGRFPVAIGKVRAYPPKATQEYTYLSGTSEVLCAAFEGGYGRLDISEIKIGDKDISTFSSITMEKHEGVESDTPYTIIQFVAGEKRLNHELTPQFVPAWEMTDGEAEKVGWDVYFPNGLYKIVEETVNGVVYQRREATSISLGLWSALSGDLGNEVITDNNPNPFRKTIFRSVTKGKQNTYIRRNTAEDTTGLVFDKVVLTKLQWHTLANPFKKVRDSSGNLIYNAGFALQAIATDQLQGQLEQVSALWQRYVQKYDADGEPDGDPVLSANPAWSAIWILTGPANYDPVPLEEIDLPAFYEWAQHCDTLGITYNKMIDSETQPQAILNEMYTLGRAKQVERDGKISVIIDRAQTQVVQHFTTRNSWGFHWKATRAKTPEQIKVQFLNPDKDWQMDEVIIYAPGKDETNFRGTQTIQLPGCTSADVARRYGEFVRRSTIARRRVYQFYASIEAIICTRGDLVRVSHPMIGAGTGTGLIKELITNGGGDITGIRIDSRVQMLADKLYQVRIRQIDGSSYVGLVIVNPGNQSTLSLATPIPSATEVKPTVGDLVMFGEQPDESREMVISNVEWSEGMVALITCLDHAPTIYGGDDEPLEPFVSKIQRRHLLKPDVPVPVINRVVSDESVLERDSDGAFKTRIVMEMEGTAANIQYFEVQFKIIDSNTWRPAQVFAATSGIIKIDGVEDGVRYDIRVRSRRYDFFTSEWNESIKNHLCVGKTTPPPDLPPLELDPDTGNIRAYPDVLHGFNVPPDYAGIHWKMAWGDNSNWAQAMSLSQLSTTNILDISKYAKGLKTILAKAVDVAGNESLNAAVIVKDFGENIPDNIVLQTDMHPTWEGSHTGQINGDDELEAVDASLFYQGADKNFWIGNPAALFWGTSFAPLVYEFTWRPSRDVLKPFKVKLLLDIDSTDYVVEYSLPGANYFWSKAADGGTKRFYSTGSAPFYTSTDNWLPMPETGLEGYHAKYKFRITCRASRYKSVIRTCSVVADVPDIIKRYVGIVISNAVAGAVIPIVPGTFRVISYVNPALVKDVSYPDATSPEVDQSVDPPVIRMKDAANAYTTGRVNVEVGGY